MALIVGEVAEKDVYLDFQIEYNINDNSYYQRDNWVKKIRSIHSVVSDDIILKKDNIIQSEGASIWLTANGDICYRFSSLGKIHTAPIAKINLVFSSFLCCNFQITHTVSKNIATFEKTENKLTISISQLLLVEAEKFSPYEKEEFYTNDNDKLIYRNTFKPSYFLQLDPELPKNIEIESTICPTEGEQKETKTPMVLKEPQKSITLQYIYYLCKYNRGRFNYLINWLASFFKNLSRRSNSILVLYGDNKSGIDILFNNIITPLFGEEYTLNITDSILKTKNISKSINEKLFYNLNNISKIATENETIRTFLQNLFPDRQKYAQMLITIEEPELSYIDKNFENYTVFRVPDMINTMYIPDWYKSDKTKLTKSELVDDINEDLENFAKILKLYPNDDYTTPKSQDNFSKFLIHL